MGRHGRPFECFLSDFTISIGPAASGEVPERQDRSDQAESGWFWRYIDLSANFPRRKLRTVYVDIRIARLKRGDRFGKRRNATGRRQIRGR